MIDSFIAESEFLQSVHQWVLKHIAPQSMQLDTDFDALLNAFKGLGEQGWLALRVPQEKGGFGIDSSIYFGFQFLLARYSGALAFLQTQHQSAAGFISGGRNSELQATYLPSMATGLRRVGIGYSHLRRPVSPIQAVVVEGGYRLTGDIPWVTGEGFFQDCVAAATLPSGEAVLGLIPLAEQGPIDSAQSDIHQQGRLKQGRLKQGSLMLGAPMALVSMTVTNTVRVALDNWFLPEMMVVDVKPVDWLPMRDRQNVLKAASFALGCAQAGLDLITDAIDRKNWRSLTPHRDQLQHAMNDCFTVCIQAIGQASLEDVEAEQFGFSPGQFIGNADLVPERTFQCDIGVEQTLLDGRLVFDATYFRGRVMDEIVPGFNVEAGLPTSVNAFGESPRQGVELQMTANPIDPLTLIASYTYTLSEEGSTDLQEVRRPRHAAGLDAIYRFANDRATVGLGVTYSGDQRDLDFGAGTFPAPLITLDSFVLVSLQGSYDVTDNLAVFARVENATNSDYQEVLNFETQGVAGFAGLRLSF